MTTETETFAFAVTHNGQTYYSTGKTGRNRKTGTLVQEMEANDAHRIWIDSARRVYPD